MLHLLASIEHSQPPHATGQCIAISCCAQGNAHNTQTGIKAHAIKTSSASLTA